MPDAIGRNEWLSENAHRSFPLRSGQDKSDDTGVVLPDSFLLDFRCVVVPFHGFGHYDEDDLSVRMVSASGSIGRDGIARMSASFSIGALSGESTAGSAGFGVSTSFDLSDGCHGDAFGRWSYNHEWGFLSYRALNIRCTFGVPVSDDRSDPWYNGATRLFGRGLEILPSRCVVVPGGIGVDNLLMKKDVGYDLLDGRRVSGSAHVRDGRNTEFRVRNGELHLIAYSGAGNGAGCPGSGQGSGRGYIRFINGQHAGSDGDFRIVGGPGIEVGKASYGSIPGVSVTTGSVVNEFAKPLADRG